MRPILLTSRQVKKTLMTKKVSVHRVMKLVSATYGGIVAPEKEGIQDRTETNLVNLRRTIYLTIMNALNYEEAVHKLLKIQIKEGDEVRIILLIVYVCP